MAEPLKYTPPSSVPRATPRQDLEATLAALHEIGAFRVVRDLALKLGHVTELGTSKLNTAEGRNAIGVLAVAGTALMKLDPHALQKVATALTTGLSRLHTHREALADPPGVLGLMRRLRGKEARRGFEALIILLETLGTALAPESAQPEPLPEHTTS